jgi:hypothetical protein
MLDKSDVLDLMAVAEKNVMCSEAVELLERCLAEKSSSLLESFMQRKMLDNPVMAIDMFQDLAESVHQHMIALQESLFDMRTITLNTLKRDFKIDLAPLVPLELIEEYHALELDEALVYVTSRYPNLSDADLVSVCHNLHNTVLRAGQITQSLVLVREILEYIFDWSEALSVFTIQKYWQYDFQHTRKTPLH